MNGKYGGGAQDPTTADARRARSEAPRYAKPLSAEFRRPSVSPEPEVSGDAYVDCLRLR